MTLGRSRNFLFEYEPQLIFLVLCLLSPQNNPPLGLKYRVTENSVLLVEVANMLEFEQNVLKEFSNILKFTQCPICTIFRHALFKLQCFKYKI